MLIKRELPKEAAEKEKQQINRVTARRNPLLADDMGSGKTIQAIRD